MSFFQQLAAATGGQVHETDKDHIGDVLNEVLEVVNIPYNVDKGNSKITELRAILQREGQNS